MEPFLPWPGSKSKVASKILASFPQKFGAYFEPFVGSGSMFFALAGKREFETAKLSDKNVNLINCYRAVMEQPERVEKMLLHCLERNSEEFYAAMREQMANPSVFLYVMRAAFSSMYRENLAGKFNVPWRKQDFAQNNKVISFDTQRIHECSAFLNEKNVTLEVADWMEAVQDAKAGDLVYFDPPYLPFTENGFVTYVRGGYNEGDHVFLRTQSRMLAERGVHVVLSNSDVPASRRIYGEPARMMTVSNAVKSTATVKGIRNEGLWIWSPITSF